MSGRTVSYWIDKAFIPLNLHKTSPKSLPTVHSKIPANKRSKQYHHLPDFVLSCYTPA